MQGLHTDVEARAPATGPPRRRRWSWIAGGVALLALLAAGFWTMQASTVSTGSYDDAVAARDAARADLVEVEASLAAAQSRVSSLTAGVDTAEADVERLTSALAGAEADTAAAVEDANAAAADLDDLRERLITAEGSLRDAGEAVEAILAPASALAMWDANRPSEMLDDLEAAGADITVADDMLAALGVADTTREFVTDDLFVLAYLTALAEAGPEAEAAWDAYLRTPSGSDEEWAAHQELYWQLEALTIERIQDAMRMLGALVGSPGV